MVNGPESSSGAAPAAATVALSSHSPSCPALPVTSSGPAHAGAARAATTIRMGALGSCRGAGPCGSRRLEEGARIGDLGPAAVGALGDLDDLAIVLPRLVLVAGLNGGLGGARIGAEPVRLLLQRR